MSPKELRYLRHELEDQIQECHISRAVDIKLYNIDRYKALCHTPCFEQCIQKDLVCIMDW